MCPLLLMLPVPPGMIVAVTEPLTPGATSPIVHVIVPPP
jgi:hypothetical protein